MPLTDSTVWVLVDNTTYWTLPRTFSFPNYTYHTIEVLNLTISVASTGARYVWKQWTLSGLQWTPTPMMRTPLMAYNYTSTSNGVFIAEFERQFQLTLSFTDPSGQPVGPPSSITLQTGSSTTTTSSYSNQWLTANVWKVVDAQWGGSYGMVFGNPTIDLTRGPVSTTVPLNAYSATIRLVDRANNPVVGASVTVVLANSTSRVFTTDGEGSVRLGHIPLGPYTARIMYQNQDMGNWTVDASRNPVSTIALNVGGQGNAPVVSAVVILTIFGLALFLLLLAIKVRKPPAPPTI